MNQCSKSNVNFQKGLKILKVQMRVYAEFIHMHKSLLQKCLAKKEYVRYIIVLAGVVKEMLNKVRKWDRFAKQIILRTSWEPTESHFD